MFDNAANQTTPTTSTTTVATSNGHYLDEYVPPQATQVSSQPTTEPADASPDLSQSLEDQNIFTLLGVEDATDEEKESFLDELQQVIWEDFLENDVELLLTESEMVELRQILDALDKEELQKQEETVLFLEKLIPDLEEIMLEKALELKEDMAKERLSGLRDFYSNDVEKLNKVDEAAALVNQGSWRDAAQVMNSIK
jgi:hypothetical protein